MSEKIILCRACGHSHGFGSRLSIGSDECGRAVEIVDENEWRRIAPRLKLTKEGQNLKARLPVSA